MRPETGPLAFPNDWPGIFIRGDNAMYYHLCLQHVIHVAEQMMLANKGDKLQDAVSLTVVKGLSELLAGCDATNPKNKDSIQDAKEIINYVETKISRSESRTQQ